MYLGHDVGRVTQNKVRDEAAHCQYNKHGSIEISLINHSSSSKSKDVRDIGQEKSLARECSGYIVLDSR